MEQRGLGWGHTQRRELCAYENPSGRLWSKLSHHDRYGRIDEAHANARHDSSLQSISGTPMCLNSVQEIRTTIMCAGT